MREVRIGILGASGNIGSDVTRWLAQEGYSLRLGARCVEPLQNLIKSAHAQCVVVDIYDHNALIDFCRDCSVIVNCAGPSYKVLDRVARAAAEVNAAYIDVSGDGPVYHLLQQQKPSQSDWIAVLSAGMLPGLANLVPSWMGHQSGGSLTIYSGGVERVSGAAAADLVLSLNEQCSGLQSTDYWYGEAGASWQLGRRSRHSLQTQEQIELAHFSNQATLLPYLSADAERLALRHNFANLKWFNVFNGQRLRETLTSLRGQLKDDEASLQSSILKVEQASEIDLLGRKPYYNLMFDLEQPDQPTRRTIISTNSSLSLTAATAVSCVLSVLRGDISAGIHFTDQVLSAHQTINDITRLHAGTSVTEYQLDTSLEEGVL